MNKYNSNIKNTQIKNKEIIPLFSTPVQLKEIKLKKNILNRLNINSLEKRVGLLEPVPARPNGDTLIVNGGVLPKDKASLYKNAYKVNTLNEILKIYLRGINLYNNTFVYFLNKENNNKLKLIRELKNDEYNKINIIYNNYLYLINRYLPIFKFRSLIYKLELFADQRILKYNKIYTYTYRLRNININKNFKNVNKIINKNKKIYNINIRMVSKLLEKGDKLYLEMMYLINKKKNIINKYKLNNLFSPIKYFIYNILNKKALLQELKVISESNKNNYNKLFSLRTNIENNKNINKNNIINILNTRKSILNYNKFDLNTDVLNKENNNYSSPVEVMYYKNNKPIINQYLKEMSKFNMSRKGIFIKYNNIIAFNFNSNTNKLIKNIYKLLFASFKAMYCLISKPVFVITPDKIKIQLFYYLIIPNLLKLKEIKLFKNKKFKLSKFINMKEYKFKLFKDKKQMSKFRRFKKRNINFLNLNSNVLTKVFSNKFKILCNILSNLFKKPVELNLTRLHYPYFDSNILVNLLGIMINKIKLRIIIRKLFANTVIKNLNTINLNRNNNFIPAFFSGININVGGRLMTQKVVPRKTVKTVIRGASAKSKVNYLDVGRYSNKNRRGAFTITVKSGQNFF